MIPPLHDDIQQARDHEHAKRVHLAELEQILGQMRASHDRVLQHTDGFSIRHDELLGGYRGEFRAEITVHSWHCLLMIAKLVAEDGRVQRAAAPSPGEP